MPECHSFAGPAKRTAAVSAPNGQTAFNTAELRIDARAHARTHARTNRPLRMRSPSHSTASGRRHDEPLLFPQSQTAARAFHRTVVAVATAAVARIDPRNTPYRRLCLDVLLCTRMRRPTRITKIDRIIVRCPSPACTRVYIRARIRTRTQAHGLLLGALYTSARTHTALCGERPSQMPMCAVHYYYLRVSASPIGTGQPTVRGPVFGVPGSISG